MSQRHCREWLTVPPASVLAMPAACSGISAPPTEAEQIAAATGGNAADFANAIMPPASPSRNSCTVLLRVVRAGSMAPLASGFQVALDKTVDLDHHAARPLKSRPGRFTAATRRLPPTARRSGTWTQILVLRLFGG